MYNIGDKILYPLYGAGVIEDIEQKEIDGELLYYYVLNIPIGNLLIKISVAKAEELGVRPVLSRDAVLTQLATATTFLVEMPDNWNLRYKENMERIKTGELTQVAVVYRSLLFRERERGLSTAEKKMMTNAKQILLSEIVLSLDVDRQVAEDLLGNTFQ